MHRRDEDYEVRHDCSCMACSIIFRPARNFRFFVLRFSQALGENLGAVISAEGLALALSSFIASMFFGAIYTIPVYWLGTFLGTLIPEVFNVGAWDIEAAWALSTLAFVLVKSVTFTIRDEE